MKKTRREFLKKTGAVAVPTAVLGGMWYARNADYRFNSPLTDADIARVRRHPEIEQEFWDRFLAEHPIPNCERIIKDHGYQKYEDYYKRNREKFGEDSIRFGYENGLVPSVLVPTSINIIGRAGKLPVFVNDLLVVRDNDTGDFICDKLQQVSSGLEDHEGTHLTDLAEGIKINSTVAANYSSITDPKSRGFFQILMDARAYYTQLKKMKPRGIASGRFYKNVGMWSAYYVKGLYEGTKFRDPAVRYYAQRQLEAFPDVSLVPIGQDQIAIKFDFFP